MVVYLNQLFFIKATKAAGYSRLSKFEAMQCSRGDRGWLSHGLVVTRPISYSLDGGTLWGFTRAMRIAD